MFAIFENEGTLDQRLLTTLGVNVKPNTTSPIGFFGTGLKYALAVLARMNIPTWVQFGNGTEYMLRCVETNIRGKMFDMIELVFVDKKVDDTINLPFTTEFGKQWEMWQVFRELESNCRDENGKSYVSGTRPDPCTGIVRVIAAGMFADRFSEMLRSTFFNSGSRPTMKAGAHFELLQQPSSIVYYRGIRVMDITKPMAYTYNILSRCDLTEDRTLKYEFEICSAVRYGVVLLRDPEIITGIIAPRDRQGWENDQRFTAILPEDCEVSAAGSVEVYAKVVKKLFDERDPHLNRHIVDELLERAAEKHRYKRIDVHGRHKVMLDRAIHYATRMGFPVDTYEIVVSANLGEHILGAARDNVIYISTAVFDMGEAMVIGTLIEEYTHLRRGYVDCSRELQDHFLQNMVRLGLDWLYQSGERE